MDIIDTILGELRTKKYGTEVLDQSAEAMLTETLEKHAKEINVFAQKNGWLNFVMQLIRNMPSPVRIFAGNALAEFFAHNKDIHPLIGHPAAIAIRALTNSSREILEGGTSDEIEQTLREQVDRKVTKYPFRFTKSKRTPIHAADCLCDAPKEELTDVLTVEQAQRAVDHGARIMCPNCFGNRTVINVTEEPPPTPRSWLRTVPANKRDHATGLIFLLEKYLMYDESEDPTSDEFEVITTENFGILGSVGAVLGGRRPQTTISDLENAEQREEIEAEMQNRPGFPRSAWRFIAGGPPSRRIRRKVTPPADLPDNPFENGLDGMAAKFSGALHKAIREDPEALVEHLSEDVTIDMVLQNPKEHAHSILGLVYGGYAPTMTEVWTDRIDSWVSLPWLKRRFRALLNGGDLGSLFSVVMKALIAFVTGIITFLGGPTLFVLGSLGMIILGVLGVSGWTFITSAIELVLHAPASDAEAVKLLETLVWATLGIFLARFLLPIISDAVGVAQRTLKALNPMDEQSVGGIAMQALAEGARKQLDWEIKIFSGETGGAAGTAHPRLLKSGLTLTIIATVGVTIIGVHYMTLYGWSSGVLVMMIFAFVGCVAEFTKLASIRLDDEFMTDMSKRMIKTASQAAIGMVAFLIIATLLTRGKIWWEEASAEDLTGASKPVPTSTVGSGQVPGYCRDFPNLPKCK